MFRRFCFVLSFCFFIPSTYALDLELTQGISSALPVGVDTFSGDDEAKDFHVLIQNDLKLSGQFKIIPSAKNAEMSLSSWRAVGADSLVSGSVRRLGSGYLEIYFELTDVVNKGRILTSKTFQVEPSQQRELAHHISDLIYQKLLGEKGIFSTRIAYILVQDLQKRKRYSLEVADIDGYNPQSLLVSSEPIMSPSWSPDGTKLAYVSFEQKKAQVYTVELSSGKRQLVTDFAGINGAPVWSPDGKKLAVVLSKSGSPKIYEVSLNNGALRQLTFGTAIDTEPRYAPDGKHMLFTSGRGGAPQIYRLDFSTGKVQRVTYDGNYNARASYTPDMKNIIMLHREERNFNIGLQKQGGERITQLTYSLMDESPTVSPNGRLVLYATRFNDKGVLAIVSTDGRIRMRLPSREGDVQEPSWSPYLG